ncbi:unnamed protein product [Chondrus crispus]|uniref:Tc1-like transposase DDE domain-containing protein n=1 Tax=Chondrus crispus TaxID=2769 RepID=R7Q9K6_CHOCR|nr:unnamed protein product [Chondrus crispus]CDF35222.1 unnamed protein product [Chondrus crispus]|eukprot:XP_005715041.1 unnamed protein product [Chondrus crispus]
MLCRFRDIRACFFGRKAGWSEVRDNSREPSANFCGGSTNYLDVYAGWRTLPSFTAGEKWLSDNGISLLEWPAYSPDLNPIENLWGILVRSVYAQQRQFEDIESLTECIMAAWANIAPNTLQKLTESMEKRCFDVMYAKGKKICY